MKDVFSQLSPKLIHFLLNNQINFVIQWKMTFPNYHKKLIFLLN